MRHGDEQTIPKSLSDTVKDLNVSSWDEVKRRVPTLAALDSHHSPSGLLAIMDGR